jgi:hypothetical protein
MSYGVSSIPDYIVRNDTVLFRQSFERDILIGLFTTLYALGLNVQDTNSRIYPYRLQISESEFLSCLEMAKGA